MRHIRGKQLKGEDVAPLPASWRFLPDEEQLHVEIGSPDSPRYKLVFGKGGFLTR